MGNICTRMADSFQCMTKPLQYCTQPPIKLIKIKKEKRTVGKASEGINVEKIQQV